MGKEQELPDLIHQRPPRDGEPGGSFEVYGNDLPANGTPLEREGSRTFLGGNGGEPGGDGGSITLRAYAIAKDYLDEVANDVGPVLLKFRRQNVKVTAFEVKHDGNILVWRRKIATRRDMYLALRAFALSSSRGTAVASGPRAKINEKEVQPGTSTHLAIGIGRDETMIWEPGEGAKGNHHFPPGKDGEFVLENQSCEPILRFLSDGGVCVSGRRLADGPDRDSSEILGALSLFIDQCGLG